MSKFQFKWKEIANAPEGSGVYAWYYTPEISKFDVDSTIKQIEIYIKAGDKKLARELIRDFFDKFLFQYFTEEPYQLYLKGPLKPKYEGQLFHSPSLSDSLIERILEEPIRLVTIQSILKSSVPDFASPIYIGMSEYLKARLCKHKALIEGFYSTKKKSISFSEKDKDQCFAWQIFSRNIHPPSLFVIVKEIDGDTRNYVDIENILNRIHFPVFGRN